MKQSPTWSLWGISIQKGRDPAVKIQMVREYLSGKTLKEVGHKYGLSPQTVRLDAIAYCKKANLARFMDNSSIKALRQHRADFGF